MVSHVDDGSLRRLLERLDSPARGLVVVNVVRVDHPIVAVGREPFVEPQGSVPASGGLSRWRSGVEIPVK